MDSAIAIELENVKGMIRSLVAASPLGMTVQMLINDLEIIGEVVDYARFGFPNFLLFLRSIPHTVRLSDCSYTAILAPVAIEHNKCSPAVPSAVQNNLRELLAMHPNGIWMLQLQKSYERKFCTALDYNQYGYVTLMKMCLDLPHIMCYHHTQFGGGVIYDMTSHVHNEERAEVIQVNNLDDYINVGDKIEAAKLNAKDDLAYIRISEAHDLSKFWFQWHSSAMDEFHKDLNLFYHANSEALYIPPENVVEGLYCIVSVGNSFQRAMITNTLVINQDASAVLNVFCVDTGAVLKSCGRNIFFMEKRFAKMQRQAMRGRLAEVVPPIWGQPWCRKASKLFVDYVQEKRFLVKLVKVEIEDPKGDAVYNLKLFEHKHSGNAYVVQDLFIGLKLAIHWTGTQLFLERETRDFESIYHHHLYPTFKQLETGNIATASEVCELLYGKIRLQNVQFNNEVDHQCSYLCSMYEDEESTSRLSSSLREVNHTTTPQVSNEPLSMCWNPNFRRTTIEEMRMCPAAVLRSKIRISNYIQEIPFMGKCVHLVRIVDGMFVVPAEIYRVFGITTHMILIREKLMSSNIHIRRRNLVGISADIRDCLLFARLIMPEQRILECTCQSHLETVLQIMQSSMEENNA